MTYAEAIQFLDSLRWFGAKFGLENTLKLAAKAGNPQNQLRFIHVAGTNGKGSTCAMLESIYRAAGLRVGLFTSPHLVSFRERIQVNREWISEADVVRCVDDLRQRLERGSVTRSISDTSQLLAFDNVSAGGSCCGSQSRAPGDSLDACPTFFEFVTVMALKYFAEQKCDMVIWETGLGGRLDATNIVTPLASVITNVQYDHQKWLGNTLEQIAAEKAGIIKPGVPIVTATDAPEALEVIRRVAEETRSRLTVAPFSVGQASRLLPSEECESETGATPVLPLLGKHQQLNAALAMATVGVLQDKIPVKAEAIRRGLETVQWPGRSQLVTRLGGKKILLDAAHNSAGATTLRAALEEHFPGSRPAFILGVMQDKDWDLMCEILAPLAGRIVCVGINSERSADPAQLREACQRTNPDAEVAVCPTLAEALAVTASEPFVVIAGSIYLIGEAMERLHLAPNPATDEKPLNEWIPRR